MDEALGILFWVVVIVGGLIWLAGKILPFAISVIAFILVVSSIAGALAVFTLYKPKSRKNLRDKIAEKKKELETEFDELNKRD